MRILLADDEPKVRRALRLQLEREGWVRVMGEAGQAREMLAEEGATLPDLILLGRPLRPDHPRQRPPPGAHEIPIALAQSLLLEHMLPGALRPGSISACRRDRSALRA